jgi:molybdenum cofactor cytidylyltransferase
MGQLKQLLPWRERTLLRHAAETALGSGVRPVVVVLGAAAGLCRKELQGLEVTPVENSKWREGMGTSVAAGIGALLDIEREIPAALFMLVDQPALTPSYLELLIAEWGRRPDSIFATRYGNSGGTPAVFPKAHFGELRSSQGDRGARDIIHRMGATLLEPDSRLFDLDTPESYADARGCTARESGPVILSAPAELPAARSI